MSSAECPLEVSGVSFQYANPSLNPFARRASRSAVLKDFSVRLAAGEISVLVAPNGSGKTTLLWLAAGLLRPQAGQVRVFGRDPFLDRAVLGEVGFLAEGAPLPEGWTVAQVLAFQQGTFPRWDQTLCTQLLERFQLLPEARVRTLSRGERGKLALTAVLCTRPKLLLLDEPTLGLDLASRRAIRAEILDQLAREGCTVLLSSHEVAEAEGTADRLLLLQKGRLTCDRRVDALLEEHRLLSWEGRTPSPPVELGAIALPDRLSRRALATHWDEPVARAWLEKGGQVHPADLETVYLAMTGEVHHA